MLSVPLPPIGFSVEIVSLPPAWYNLADPGAWQTAKDKLFQRIGILCQSHIRAIMMGQEANKAGNIVPFLNPTNKGVSSVQFKTETQAVEIFVDDRATYLTYQEYGVSTQPMRWLVGKTIPYILTKGQRINPSSGRVVDGVTRVRFAGRGSRYVGEAQGVYSPTKMVKKESVDNMIHYSAITEATFTQQSKYNPVGLKWWHPGYPGKHFFRDGVRAGMEEIAGHVAGISFKVAGSNWEPELTEFTSEYQAMLKDLEDQLTYNDKSPFPVKNL